MIIVMEFPGEMRKEKLLKWKKPSVLNQRKVSCVPFKLHTCIPNVLGYRYLCWAGDGERKDPQAWESPKTISIWNSFFYRLIYITVLLILIKFIAFSCDLGPLTPWQFQGMIKKRAGIWVDTHCEKNGLRSQRMFITGCALTTEQIIIFTECC